MPESNRRPIRCERIAHPSRAYAPDRDLLTEVNEHRQQTSRAFTPNRISLRSWAIPDVTWNSTTPLSSVANISSSLVCSLESLPIDTKHPWSPSIKSMEHTGFEPVTPSLQS